MFGQRKDGSARRPGRTDQRSARIFRAAGRDRSALFARRASRKNTPAERPAKTESPARPDFFSRWDWGRVRLWVVGIVFSLLGASLWARAYYLQIVMGPEYAERARRQHTAREVLTGVRGNIMDRNGNILARSVDCSSVWANPSLVRDKQETAVRLARLLGEPSGRIMSLLNEKKQFVWVARKLGYHVAEKIKALNLPGISFISEFERVYPYKHLAGQLLGFVNIDDKGLEGIERAFDEKLAGRSVTQLVERDAAGRRLMARGAGDISELGGQDVRLSIDLQIQFFAEEALAESVNKYGAKWGGCIVVDVDGGDILAWAQYPFFDPNNVQAAPAGNRRNRLAMDMLEQGSTIKSFLVASALEEKIVHPTTEIDCEKGVWKLRSIVLHDTHPYSKLSVAKILHVSSNIGAAKIGLKLGAAKYRDYLSRLGFGEYTGLPLAGEARGILRSAKKWTDIDLANASFGQSFSATLAQMARAYLCIANDGTKMDLRLLADGPGHNADPEGDPGRRIGSSGLSSAAAEPAGASRAGPAFAASPDAVPDSSPSGASGRERIFSPDTVKLVRAMMHNVVEEDGGTGKEARIAGLDVGGKTGTAQKAAGPGGYGKGRVGSFAGLVPIGEPRYLILVLLDEPSSVQYGGLIAAPVFRHVALNTLAYYGELPDMEAPGVKEAVLKAEARKSGAEGKGKKTERPALADAARDPARISGLAGSAGSEERNLRKPVQNLAGADPVAFPNGKPAENRVRSGQSAQGYGPAEGRDGHGADPVPSVVGYGMRNAVEVFAARGIVPVIRGKGGFVVRQVPEPGRPWPDGKRECILWLEERAS